MVASAPRHVRGPDSGGIGHIRQYARDALLTESGAEDVADGSGSPDVPISRPVSGDARWHQMAPLRNSRIRICPNFKHLQVPCCGMRTAVAAEGRRNDEDCAFRRSFFILAGVSCFGSIAVHSVLFQQFTWARPNFDQELHNLEGKNESATVRKRRSSVILCS